MCASGRLGDTGRNSTGGDVTMAKYGLFRVADKTPLQEFEGEYMTQEGQVVKIFKAQVPEQNAQVAALYIDKDLCVRRMD
jgi:hypothetical protein